MCGCSAGSFQPVLAEGHAHSSWVGCTSWRFLRWIDGLKIAFFLSKAEAFVLQGGGALKSLEKITLPMFSFLFLPLSTFLPRGYGGNRRRRE